MVVPHEEDRVVLPACLLHRLAIQLQPAQGKAHFRLPPLTHRSMGTAINDPPPVPIRWGRRCAADQRVGQT